MKTDDNNIKSISYLVPAYNHENYIEDALNSVFKDSEILNCEKNIIIINDGSTDNSHLIIQNWINNNGDSIKIKYINRENKGLTITLNELVSNTNSKYIRFCSSDDMLIIGSTSILLDILEQNNNLLAASGDGVVIDKYDKEIHSSCIKYHGGNIQKLINKETCYKELIINWCMAGPCILIDRKFYDDIKYLENEPIDDLYLYFALIEKNALRIIDSKTCYYRVHDTNTAKTLDIDKKLKNLKSFLKIILNFKKLETKYKVLIALKNLTMAKISYLESKYFKGLFYLVRYLYFRTLGK